MLIFREYRDGKALVREEWRVRVIAPDNGPWCLSVESYQQLRKANHRNKHWIGVSRWNRAYGAGERLKTCPLVPLDLEAEAAKKLAACPIEYSKTEASWVI